MEENVKKRIYIHISSHFAVYLKHNIVKQLYFNIFFNVLKSADRFLLQSNMFMYLYSVLSSVFFFLMSFIKKERENKKKS